MQQNEFQPSPKQRQFLEYIHEHPTFGSIGHICDRAAIPRASYYAWSRNPAFRAWFMREWARALLFDGWHVLQQAYAQMNSSAHHFRAINKTIFTEAGWTALEAWQQRVLKLEETATPDQPPAAAQPASTAKAARAPRKKTRRNTAAPDPTTIVANFLDELDQFSPGNLASHIAHTAHELARSQRQAALNEPQPSVSGARDEAPPQPAHPKPAEPERGAEGSQARARTSAANQ